jgi:hypothetical protein
MAIKDTLCTIQDVRNLSEYITTEVRDDARVRQFIIRADSVVRDALRPYYTIDTELEETAPYNGPPQAPYAVTDQGIAANSGTGDLSDVTPSTSAKTEVWTITFFNSTAFSVSGTASGSQGSGNRNSNFTSTNGYLTIPTGNWSGTSSANDKIMVATYRAKPLIVTLSAMLAAGLLLRSVFEGGDEVSAKGLSFTGDAEAILSRLTRPYEDDGMQLDTFSERDISPEGVSYTVDIMGRDVSKYTDNEMTPWSDSTAGGGALLGFFIGPVWVS